jgi:hypothetical protein
VSILDALRGDNGNMVSEIRTGLRERHQMCHTAGKHFRLYALPANVRFSQWTSPIDASNANCSKRGTYDGVKNIAVKLNLGLQEIKIKKENSWWKSWKNSHAPTSFKWCTVVVINVDTPQRQHSFCSVVQHQICSLKPPMFSHRYVTGR